MSYTKSDGTYVHTEPFVAVPSAARTANGSGPIIETGKRIALRGLLLDVTAASGTVPTLDVRVETSSDGSTWSTVGSFGQKTAVSSERKTFVGLDRFVRMAWTVGGTTPSFTFTLAGGELA